MLEDFNSSEDKNDSPHIPSHPWRARFIVSLIMIVISFVGLVVTDIWRSGAWNYWRIASPIFALLSIGLSWYLRKKEHSISLMKLWHEILHWVTLILAVFLFSVYTDMGIMGRFESGLAILTLLATTIFLAGIYFEYTFLVIGVLLGFFAFSAAFLTTYIYTIMLPVALGALALSLWIATRKKKKH